MGQLLNIELDKCRVLVVDGDSVTRRLAAKYLSAAGVQSVVESENGSEAWRLLTTEKFHAIVFDWNLDGVSGLALFNRIRRSRKFASLAVLVSTHEIKPEDFALLSEFPCSGLLEKPFTELSIVRQFSEIVAEAQSYEQNRDIIEQFIHDAAEGGKDVARAFDKFFKTLPRPVPLALIAGRQLRELKRYGEAEAILRKALNRDDRKLPVIAELGKVLIAAGKTQEAVQLLNHARNFSPHNVDRLLTLGEVNLRNLNPKQAKALFAEVIGIDADDAKANQGIVVAQNIEDYLTFDKGETVSLNFASLLNVIGISLVRSGKHAEGIKQYEAAMRFVHADQDSSKLAFNLGLGYMRWGKPETAKKWFEKSTAAGSTIVAKAGAYIRKLEEKYPSLKEAQLESTNADSVVVSAQNVSSAPVEIGGDESFGNGGNMPLNDSLNFSNEGDDGEEDIFL